MKPMSPKLPASQPGWVESVELPPEKQRAILRARARALAQAPGITTEVVESTETLLFLLAHETCAIETRWIREVYPLTDLTPLPGTPDFILGVINLRGQILAIIDIRKFLNLPEKGITHLNRVIVVQNETLELGILADEIIGIRDLPARELHPLAAHGEYLKAVTGEGLILLDMERLLSDPRLIVHDEAGS